MHGSGVGTAFVLFVFEVVQFALHVDRDPDMIIGEPINGMGIVQQNISIQNIVLDACSVAIQRFRCAGKARLFGRFLKQSGLIF